MRLRSLESRIVTLFLLLILAVQLAGFFAIRTGINRNARASIRNELAVGEHIFRRLVDQNAQKLTEAAQSLTLDFGFRQAVGNNDSTTIASALENLGERIGASRTMLIGTDRQIKASTSMNMPANLITSIQELVDKAARSGSATAVSIVHGRTYQIIVVPVKAPVTIAWVAMTLPIAQQLVMDMHDLSSLEVSVLTKEKTGTWSPEASTLSVTDAASLATQLAGRPANATDLPELNIAGNEFSTRSVPLAQNTDQAAIVVLQRSISEAVAPYARLQLYLLILTAIGIGIAVVISIFTAKRMTGPLRQLTAIAKRLGTGDYQGQIEIRRDDEIGELSKAFVNMREGISNRELEIRRLAYWDTLTTLPNRAQFVDWLTHAIAESKEHYEACYILMMDLDRFKNVNDVLGQRFGDALLRQVAERLKQQLNNKGKIARLGGDEFAVLLTNSNRSEAQAVAAQILKSLEVPLSLEDQTVDLGAGIGIAGFPEHGTDAESLLSHAEVAMYIAKRSGNEAVVYDPAIDKISQQNLSLLSELRRAIEHNELRLQVQPKVQLATGKVLGVESLIRWVHPEKGLVFPDSFIPFAEKTGFIRNLTYWMLERSAELCAECIAKGIHLKFSVNLSTRDLLDQDLPAKFTDILARNNVEPTSFCLEITESAIMDDPVRAQQTLERLHAMHVDLSIDDFGTGYSSLAYLKRLPVDELKIDKSFVMSMEHDADDTKIVRSTIDLGHNMGLRVVAEGIESEAIWHQLAKLGCDQGQGYLISKPMPADQLMTWIEKWTPPTPTPSHQAQAKQNA
jgi:diguanylate cyclase (GGDEF)-like protein